MSYNAGLEASGSFKKIIGNTQLSKTELETMILIDIDVDEDSEDEELDEDEFNR